MPKEKKIFIQNYWIETQELYLLKVIFKIHNFNYIPKLVQSSVQVDFLQTEIDKQPMKNICKKSLKWKNLKKKQSSVLTKLNYSVKFLLKHM